VDIDEAFVTWNDNTTPRGMLDHSGFYTYA
jgi:hypothetical protein